MVRRSTVILHFYEQQAGCPDELIHEIFAVDMSADGQGRPAMGGRP